MTHLVRFIRSSLLTFARKPITVDISENRNRLCTIATKQLKRSCASTSAIYCCYGNRGHSNSYARENDAPVLLGASLAFLGFLFKEEKEESELVMTLKRSTLLIQRGEFKKAEQMLHLALRQAQTVQNEEGITYVYDVMANLAFEIGEYDKAQKLFKTVMQRVLATGAPQDDLRIVTMSLKMAKILEVKKDYDNAENGYKYCLKILQEYIDQGTEDYNIIMIWAMNLDWYAHLLLDLSRYTEAMRHMEKAYNLWVKLFGENHIQSIVLLNDLGSISCMKGNLDEAVGYLTKAAEIGETVAELEDIASIHINLGNVYMKKGLLDEAKRSCTTGWKLAKKTKNDETMSEAKLCLQEVDKLLRS